jgi:exonuclease SbcC
MNEEKLKQLNDVLKQEKMAEIKVAELKREIEVFSRQINEMKERIKKTEEVKLQAHYLSDLEEWLLKKFIPIIVVVEKNVFTKLKIEFSKLFSEWFGMLVSDFFNVRLSEDFTPIIEQQDYELDYAYLSGGERTAIARAYRLALNQVINSFLSKIKTKDLVILDEPTDGFSDQQLDKMRGVLEELNVSQLIIVSHEQKIESFVENVIRFKKENGKSMIEQ